MQVIWIETFARRVNNTYLARYPTINTNLRLSVDTAYPERQLSRTMMSWYANDSISGTSTRDFVNNNDLVTSLKTNGFLVLKTHVDK